MAVFAFGLGLVVGCVLAAVSLALYHRDRLAAGERAIALAEKAHADTIAERKRIHDEHVHAKFAIDGARKSGLISLN